MARKQKELPLGNEPGVAAKQIQEIDDAAEVYDKAKKRRMKATTKEVEAKTDLIDALHKHEKELGRAPDGAIRYDFENVEISLTPTDEKLKVRLKNVNDEEDED